MIESGNAVGTVRRSRHTALTRMWLIAAIVAFLSLAVPSGVQARALTTACPAKTAPTTGIVPSRSTQVIVAHRTAGTRGTFVRYQWFKAAAKSHPACSWVVVGRANAYFGARGVVPASQRVQNSYTTPAGTFGLLSAFGLRNLGTRMPYTTLNARDWWDERPASATYNRLLTNGPDGCDPANCEHLIAYTGASGGYMYNQAVFIGYNIPPHQTRYGKGSGAGIFLHYGTEPTAGCVAITSLPEMRATVVWLNPAAHPLIVIHR